MRKSNQTRDVDANRDPISGAPGAYPVETVVGAAVGAVVGGLAGKGVAEASDPTREEAYWRDHYSGRPYIERGSNYSDYGPAYAFGVDACNRYPGRTFDEVEPEISRQWNTDGGASTLRWNSARPAVRDAWDRVHGTA